MMKRQLMIIGLAGVLSFGLLSAGRLCSGEALAQGAQADEQVDRRFDRPSPARVSGEDRRRGDGPEGLAPGPPPGREHGRLGSGRGAAPLAVDDLEEAMEVLNEIQPELARRLNEIVVDEPDNAVRILNERFPRVVQMLQMKRHDPQRFALHMRSMNARREMRPLMRAHREAQESDDEETISQTRGAIRAQVEALFDIRMELRLMEIQELRDQVVELEDQLDTHRSQREALIDQQIEDMTLGRGRGGPHEERRGPSQRGPGQGEGRDRMSPLGGDDSRPDEGDGDR